MTNEDFLVLALKGIRTFKCLPPPEYFIINIHTGEYVCPSPYNIGYLVTGVVDHISDNLDTYTMVDYKEVPENVMKDLLEMYENAFKGSR